MIPEPGQHVKCFMRSTMVLEGIVQEWADTQIVLKSIDDESILIVHHPADDIILTKVILTETQEIVEDDAPPEPTEMQQQIKEKLDEVLNSEDSDLEKLNLQQLRKMVRQQDKNIITQKRKEHFGEAGHSKRAVQYSYPSAYLPGKLPNTPGAEMVRNRKK